MMRSPVLFFAAVALSGISFAPPATAGRGSSWTATPSELAQGRAEGLALTSDGRLFAAPRLTRIDAAGPPAGPAQVWAMATDAAGNLLLATGPDGQLMRIGASGRSTELYAVAEPLIRAVAVTPRGDVLVGASPTGRIYRASAGAPAEPWAELDERYVWSLALDPEGTLYAATGERGRILKILDSGSSEVFFDSDESHVVSLLALPDGGLLAGGSGRGLVYQIDAEGHALVLHDDDLPEVAALALEPDGSVVAALLGTPDPPARRPAIRLRLPDGQQIATTDDTVGSLEQSSGPTLRGAIEGLGPPVEPLRERPLGRVVRIDPSGTSRELWSSETEVPLCLTLDAAGRVLFGTGEPARLYRIEPGGDVALLASLDEAQLTGLVRLGQDVVAATSNPAAAYRLEPDRVGSGTYLSPPFDAGGPARWGAIRWRLDQPSGRVELYTRTGNSRDPDVTWSAWSPALTDPEKSYVVNPDGRFLQWRLRQIESRPQTGLTAVSVRYEPYNRAPELRALRAEPHGEDPTTAFALHWSERDPDGDAVQVTVEYRAVGTDAWVTGALADVGEPPAARAAWRDGRVIWPTATLAQGAYDVRVVATDQPDNAAGESREASRPSLRLVIDRTPPDLSWSFEADGSIEVRLSDRHSDIRRLELRQDGRLRRTARPVDGMCDSPEERFRFERPGGGGWSLRGVDAAGNKVDRPIEGIDGSSLGGT